MRQPENYCPICGVLIIGKYINHRCKPGVYSAIDAANTRAWNLEFKKTDDLLGPLPAVAEDERAFYGERLQRGFLGRTDESLEEFCRRCGWRWQKCQCYEFLPNPRLRNWYRKNMDESLIELGKDAPHWPLFVEKVSQLRNSGNFGKDTFIARQMVDDYYRLTGRMLPQHLMERLIEQVPRYQRNMDEEIRSLERRYADSSGDEELRSKINVRRRRQGLCDYCNNQAIMICAEHNVSVCQHHGSHCEEAECNYLMCPKCAPKCDVCQQPACPYHIRDCICGCNACTNANVNCWSHCEICQERICRNHAIIHGDEWHCQTHDYAPNPEPEEAVGPDHPWLVGDNLLTILPNEQFSLIQKLGRGLVGIIIAAWRESPIPEFFYTGSGWQRFDDDTNAMYPKIYKSLPGIKRAVVKLREEYPQVGIVFWMHPDAHAVPLDKIKRITQSYRFPGSPFYRRNSDEEYRELERTFTAQPSIENYSKLIAISRRMGLPDPNPPLERWQAIVDSWGSTTWDTVIEAGYSSKALGDDPESITPAESQHIQSLNYYGKPIEAEHAQRLFENRPYAVDGYAVHYDGVDGVDTTRFESLEDAADYVNDRLRDRLSSRIGGDSFSTDFATYTLEGFTFNDMAGLALENPNVFDELIYYPNGNYWDSQAQWDEEY